MGRDAHAVIDKAQAASVYVFGGGIDEDVPLILVSADGAVATGGSPWTLTLDGGFTVLGLPSCDEAIAWAVRMLWRPRAACLRGRPATLRKAQHLFAPSLVSAASDYLTKRSLLSCSKP